jgi:hypothetical protein
LKAKGRQRVGAVFYWLRFSRWAHGHAGDRTGRLVTLAPGAPMTCHATYAITAADVAAGHAANVVIAIGHPPTGPGVSDRNMAFLPGPPLVPVTGGAPRSQPRPF